MSKVIKRTYKPVPHQIFVEAWMEAYQHKHPQSWVSKKLGITRQAVSSKAYFLRSRGVNLPRLVRPKIDIYADKLNKAIEESQAIHDQ